MLGAILLAWLGSTALAAADQQTAALDASQLRISTPTYSTDGAISGASSGGFAGLTWPLILYAYSGGTLCESSSALSIEPNNAGYGWRIQITPIVRVRFSMNADPDQHLNVVRRDLKVEWRRLWNRGDKVTGDAGGSAVLTLKPGDHILLDYLGAAPTEKCQAIGMGLEIGLAPAKPAGVIETDMWLVHRLPDGSEQTQHQVLRSRVGGGVEYFFDNVKIQGTGNDVPVEVFGKISPYAIEDGSVRLRFEITRKHLTSGSSGSDLAAKPGEVLSFNLPLDPSDGALAGHRLSVRLKATVKSPE